MQVVFDHITGVIVAGAVLLIYAFIQFRGWQSASEATINYQVYSELLDLSQVIAMDIENMRTEDQTTEANSRGKLTGGSGFLCQITTSAGVTTTFSFPTLADPDAAYAMADPADADVIIVTYQLTDTKETFKLPQSNGTSTVPLYRLDRFIDGENRGGSQENITHFLVELSSTGSSTFSSSSGTCPTDLEQVRFELKLVTNGIGETLDGQNTSNQVNISRYGTTVSLPNWE